MDSPDTDIVLGEPVWSQEFYKDYMDWRSGNDYWKAAELGFMCEHACGEDPSDKGWMIYGPGTHEIIVETGGVTSEVVVRMLNSHKDGIIPPEKVVLYAGKEGDFRLQQVKYTPKWPHTRHDAFVDIVLFELDDIEAPFVKIVFTTDKKVYLDRIMMM